MFFFFHSEENSFFFSLKLKQKPVLQNIAFFGLNNRIEKINKMNYTGVLYINKFIVFWLS